MCIASTRATVREEARASVLSSPWRCIRGAEPEDDSYSESHRQRLPQALYKTSWEMKMRSLIDMAADRGAFIDQSQARAPAVQDDAHAPRT